MRVFLSIIIVFVLVSVSCWNVRGGTYRPVVNHPRILLLEGEECDVKMSVNEAPELKFVHDSILSVCDRLVDWPLLKRKLTGVRLLNVSREALRRILYLSYGYRMTGERKYADRAIKEIINVCSFEDWNPSHFLDVGEMTMAVAIGYDWLYDLIDETGREVMVEAVKEKAFAPAKNNKYNYFYRRGYNWNSVCNAGLVYGAVAMYDEMPVEADLIIERCLESNPMVLATYSPNGGYPEGYGYWSYGTTSEVLLIDVLLTAYGTDFGLSLTDGFMDTGKYMLYMTAPSGKCFNFSDTEDVAHGNIASWWFASQTGDYTILYEDLKYLSGGNMSMGELRLLPALLVFASRIKGLKCEEPNVNHWVGHGATPVYIYREGWNSLTDAYLGVKGGSPSTVHAHMDAGSFVYEHDGVRWSIDLGLQKYNSLESKGVALWDNGQNGQRWEILRMRNDYHNTLTIDGMRHIVDSSAPIIQVFNSSKRKGAIVDLTATLGRVESAHREVSLDSNNYLMVIDTIVVGSNPAKVMWVMVTSAAPVIDGDIIRLFEDGKRMNLGFQSTVKIEPRIWSNEPLHDYDESNDGTYRVGFESFVPPFGKVVFKTSLVPDSIAI